jgi:hypothetical protein
MYTLHTAFLLDQKTGEEEMETAYKATRTTKWLGALGGVIFLVVGLAVALPLLRQVLGLLDGSGSVSATGGTCSLACVSVISLGASAVIFLSVFRGSVIVVTADAVEQRQGRRVVARYPYHQVTAVRLVYQRQVTKHYRGPFRVYLYPILKVEGQFDAPLPLDLPIRFSGRATALDGRPTLTHYSRGEAYDTRAIARDFLPRLPSSVAIDPAAWAYAETGELPAPDGSRIVEYTQPIPSFLKRS